MLSSDELWLMRVAAKECAEAWAPITCDLVRCLDEIDRLRRVEEAARKVHFWNDSAEPYADLAFDDAMAELGKALEPWKESSK